MRGQAWAIHGQCVGTRGRLVGSRHGNSGVDGGHAWPCLVICSMLQDTNTDRGGRRIGDACQRVGHECQRIGTDWHGLGTDWHALAQIGMHWHGLARIGTHWHSSAPVPMSHLSTSELHTFRASLDKAFKNKIELCTIVPMDVPGMLAHI